MNKRGRLLNNIVVRITALILTLSIVLAVNPLSAGAWDQGPAYKTHQEINHQALVKFFALYGGNPKYANSQIDRAKNFNGPEVTSNSLWESGHRVQPGLKTFEDWVVHGGYSADEPNLWAAVKHFYNPLPGIGPPQLTDQVGSYLHPISARYWAFADPDNPYSWNKALEYYKKSMEIPEDDTTRVVQGSDFRDPAISAETPAAERSIYLGKAFRSLGETMHMMADMTQPAHNRNDSHPLFDIDPLETGVRDTTVWVVCDYPVEPGINAQLDSASVAEGMYDRVALFTNANFYTDDTIYDKASGVMPENGENPYPSPQFKDLVPLSSLDPVQKATGDPIIYGKYFNNKLVPLIEKSYSNYSIIHSVSIFRHWMVPIAFSLDQAGVLVPLAIKANSKLIDLFFPTMELTMELQKSTAGDSGGQNYQEFAVKSLMTHLIDRDTDWKFQGMQAIQYSGPAELWSEGRGKIADAIQFRNGSLRRPLIVYTGGSRNTQAGAPDADKVQVQDGETVYLVINAGGRVFKSNKYKISSCQVSVWPDTLNAETGQSYMFTAKAGAVPSNPVYTWKVDGREVKTGPGNVLPVTFRVAGNSTVTVTLRDGEKECTATARVTVGSPAPPPYIPPPSPVSSSVTGVIASVTPSSFKGHCPKTFNSTATITASGPCTVSYQWENSLGGKSESSIIFSGAGSRTVSGPSPSFGDSGTYWWRVHVLTPNDMTSDNAVFDLNCCEVENADFSGKWDVSGGSFGGYPSYMYLTQSGNQVDGKYDYQNGRITGTVSCGVFSGTWSEEPSYGPPHDSGPITFRLSTDSAGGAVFIGTWEYANPATEGRGGDVLGSKVR